jgi:hypothetical protein
MLRMIALGVAAVAARMSSNGAVAAAAAAVRPAPARPNVVVFMADDQDMWLGGETPIPKTRKLVADGGARGLNFFVATPVCCPSRTETLTGRYMHNLVLGAGGATGHGHDCMNQNSTNVFNDNALFPTLHAAGCVPTSHTVRSPHVIGASTVMSGRLLCCAVLAQ